MAKATGGRVGSALGIGWEGFKKIHRSTEAARKGLAGLEKAFMYWAEPDGGGALNKKAAEDLAEYISTTIKSGGRGGTALSSGLAITSAGENYVSLAPWYEEWKEEQGYGNTIGVATGQMADAVDAIKSGKGYRVGISSNKRVTTKIGKIEKIAHYAWIFEHGHTWISPKTGRKIKWPPRPIFAASFMRWVYQRLPSLFNAYSRDLGVELAKLDAIAESFKPAGEVKPEIGFEGDQVTVQVNLGGRPDEAESFTRRTGIDVDESAQKAAKEATKGKSFDIPYEEGETGTSYAIDQPSETEIKPKRRFALEEKTTEFTQQFGGITTHFAEGGELMFNSIDNEWQDFYTAWARMEEKGLFNI